MTTTNYPRCATCAHWNVSVLDKDRGYCLLLTVTSAFNLSKDDTDVPLGVPADFGCINHSEIKEP